MENGPFSSMMSLPDTKKSSLCFPSKMVTFCVHGHHGPHHMVFPRWNFRSEVPLKRTSTDSGMFSGMTPVAAAKATKPDPAGKEMPSGKRVCESPPEPWRTLMRKDEKGGCGFSQQMVKVWFHTMNDYESC